MDVWEGSLRRDGFRSTSRKSPSFSSTLLDAIYRSIDDGGVAPEGLIVHRESSRKKDSFSRNCALQQFEEREADSIRRAYVTEKWIEKNLAEKLTLRRSPDSEKFRRNPNPVVFHSTSSSSDSSSGGFSSSDNESVFGTRDSAIAFRRLPHVRTAERDQQRCFQDRSTRRNSQSVEKAPRDLSRAGKVRTSFGTYFSDQKIPKKQAVSPGARLANFLNSLFAAAGGNAKKTKLSSSHNGKDHSRSERRAKSVQASSPCSTASSLSRSCLSKAPSSRGKSVDGVKRSVRFCPVSVIVDEDCRPCGQKCLEEGNLPALPSAGNLLNDELKFHIDEANKRVEAAAKRILTAYQHSHHLLSGSIHKGEVEDDDDAASDSSSDLFELENLTEIGIERCRDELPVYETTHVDNNRAISNGSIM